MRISHALGILALALALATPPPAVRAATELTNFAGIGVGGSVLTAIAARGMPEKLATLDTGHHFTWTADGLTVDAITNDEAVVRAVDVAPQGTGGSVSVELAGKRQRLAFGVLTAAQADAAFSESADYADLAAHTRTYMVTPLTELALSFDPTTDVLKRAVFGDRGTISLLGYLRADLMLPLHAPQDRGKPIVSLSPKGLLRVDIDERGIVRKETVLLTGGDPAADAALVKALDARTYDPARFADRRVKSTFYRGITP